MRLALLLTLLFTFATPAHADDIAAAVRGLAAKGVVFTRYEGMDQDENGVWTTPGGEQVAWFPDPDGNTLSLTQFL